MGFIKKVSSIPFIRMNLFGLKIILIIIFIAGQVYFVCIHKYPTLDLEVYPNTHPSPPIIQGVTIGQTFIAQRNGLTKIEVMMGTYGRENDKDVEFTLWELNPGKKLVRKIIVNARTIRNNLFNEFKFDPVPHSRGRKFYFQFSSPASTKGNAVCCWLNKKDIYSAGELVLNGQPQNSDIVFRTYAQRPIIKELRTIVQNNWGIMGHFWVFIVVAIFFELVQIGLFIWLLNWLFASAKNRSGS